MKTITRSVLLAVSAVVLTACSSPQESRVKEAERLHKDGFVRGAVQEADRLLADSDSLTPEQIARIEAIKKSATERILRFYTSMISQHLISENIKEALEAYETAIAEYPQLRDDVSLGKRVMRAYVREGRLTEARDTASLLLAAGPEIVEREEIDAFLAKLDQLEAAKERRADLTQRVDLIGSSIGIDFVNVDFRPSCILMNQTERLTPESTQIVDEYFAAVTEETALQDELGVIPTVVY
ncbi:hypothetical protein GC173_00090 [bacterium]|nr:hypothetical protein [bacterium]